MISGEEEMADKNDSPIKKEVPRLALKSGKSSTPILKMLSLFMRGTRPDCPELLSSVL